jgi:alkylhydroperoxidase/carboxymuconolactone decarboxylase family protein YurZ
MKIILSYMGHPKELTDNSGMVEGFQELEQMLGEKPDLLPRTVLLHEIFKKNKLQENPKFMNLVVESVETNQDSETWIINYYNQNKN